MSIKYPDLNLTNFPESVDIFKTWLDIVAKDGTLIKQYQAAMQDGNEELANDIIKTIPSYQQKIVTAQDLNKLTEAVVAVERFYKTDIVPYTNQKQKEWQSIINNFSYVGEYNKNSTYKENNYVSYGQGKAIYLYIAYKEVPINTPPTNTRYWRQLTVQGKQGVSGIGVSFRKEWEISTTYQKDDIVEYNDSLWIANETTTGIEPSEIVKDWNLIYNLRPVVYPLSKERPQYIEDGELWFKILQK